MALPRPSSPRALIADIRTFVATRGQHRIIAAALALLIPAILFTAVFLQYRDYEPPAQLVQVHMWRADRTDAEIKADQKKAQAEKDARAKERQRQFQKLADQLGIE